MAFPLHEQFDDPPCGGVARPPLGARAGAALSLECSRRPRRWCSASRHSVPRVVQFRHAQRTHVKFFRRTLLCEVMLDVDQQG